MDELTPSRVLALLKLFDGRFRRMTYTGDARDACEERKGRRSIFGRAAEESMRFHKHTAWFAQVFITIMNGEFGHKFRI